MQYAELAAEVRSGRGRIPVADYKVGKYIDGDDGDERFSSPIKRSCYSFCMCPGRAGNPLVILLLVNVANLLVVLTWFDWHLCFHFPLAPSI